MKYAGMKLDRVYIDVLIRIGWKKDLQFGYKHYCNNSYISLN